MDLSSIEKNVAFLRRMINESGFKPNLLVIAQLLSHIDWLINELKSGR